MSVSREELIDFLNEAEQRGDMEAANMVLDKIEALAQESVSQPVREDYGEPVVEDGQFQIGGEVSRIKEGIGGAVEPALSLASGMVAGTVAPIGGGIQQLLNPNNPTAGFQARDRIQEALTYQPRTSAGQRVVQGMGETLAPVGEVIEKARLGDEALEAGLPEFIARQAEAIPEYAGAGLAALGLPAARQKPPLSAPRVTKTGVMESAPSPVANIKGGTETAAKFKIDKSGAVVKNPLGRQAVSRGWDDRLVGHVSTLKPAEKPIYQGMLKKAKSYFSEFSPKGRPSDVVGNQVATQVKYLKTIKTRNGKLLDKVAKQQLSQKPLNIDDFTDTVLKDIQELGGSMNDKGKLVFGRESQLYNQAGNQKALAGLFEKLKVSANPTALEVHKLKQWLSEYVSFSKSPTTKAEGISGATETMLKGYRKALNDKLRAVDKNYAKINDAYADSAGALDDLQRAVGPSTDILGDSAPAALGQKMRTFLGNNANRIKTEDAVAEIQAMANKYGGKFPDNDIAAQMRFINEMERMWGPFTETSFKSEIGQAGQRVAQSPGVAQLGREGIQLTAKQLRKAHISRESQIKAMERLLTQ